MLQRYTERDEDRNPRITTDRDNESDYEDNLSIPASPIRIIIGLVVLCIGILIAAMSESSLVKSIGAILFLVSPFIMLTNKKRDQSA